MSEASAAAVPERLSGDAAVAMLMDVPHAETPEALVEAALEVQADAPQESEAEPTAEEAVAPETAGDGAEAGAVEPVQPAVEPPAFWDDHGKAEFAKLSPEMQQFVADRARDGERFVNTKVEEAATARKAAEAASSQLGQLHQRIVPLLEKGEQAFQARWGNIDWPAFAEQDPNGYVRAQAQMTAEARELQQLDAARQVAADEAFKAHTAKVGSALATLPAFSDPATGPQRLQEVTKWATDNGATQENLRWAEPWMWQMAYDAMQFRTGQRKLTEQPKPAVAAPKPQVRPAAAVPSQTPQSRTVAQARQNFKAKPSTDSAVSLIESLGL